jgi:hypothetical protein
MEGDPEANSSESRLVVKDVLVHFRMPRHREKYVEDMTKKWTLVCHGGTHVWTTECERRNACRKCGHTADQKTAMMTDWFGAGTIFETNLLFDVSGKLNKSCRERLAASGPDDGSWKLALGVNENGGSRKRRQQTSR